MKYYGFNTEIVTEPSNFFQELQDIAESEKNAYILLSHVTENDIWIYSDWLRRSDTVNTYTNNLKANNITVVCLIGSDGVGSIFHKVPNHQVLTDQTFFLKKIYHQVIWHAPQLAQLKVPNQAQHTFDKVFICLNGAGRLQRLLFLDALEKNHLWQHGYISWYGSKEIRKGRTKLEDFQVDRTWDPLKTYTLESQANLGPNVNNFQHNFPIESSHSFLNIVVETLDTSPGFFITEKTVYPLILGKPILVLGQRYFHKKLEQLGFALHTDIFDYSFDRMKRKEDRIQGIIDNVKRLVQNKDKLIDYYKQIYSELSHNARHVSYIANRYDQTWQHIKTVVNKMPKNDHCKAFMNRMNELSCENICHPQVRLERAKKYAGLYPIILSDV